MEKLENELNYQLACALQMEDIPKATSKAIKFLQNIYGEKSVKYWALRDFYVRRILPADEDAKSLFDRNVEWLMKLRDEKALGWTAKPRYESNYFKDDTLERLDSIFEQYKQAEGRPTLEKFMRDIEDTVLKNYVK